MIVFNLFNDVFNGFTRVTICECRLTLNTYVSCKKVICNMLIFNEILWLLGWGGQSFVTSHRRGSKFLRRSVMGGEEGMKIGQNRMKSFMDGPSLRFNFLSTFYPSMCFDTNNSFFYGIWWGERGWRKLSSLKFSGKIFGKTMDQ